MTTDFFGFDTSDNHFKLQGLGDVSEMGDAILGLVAVEMGDERAALARDPQRLRSADQGRGHDPAAGTIAAQIYKGFGRWSSVCSAITCWASIVAEP